jgi:hypothetical protein
MSTVKAAIKMQKLSFATWRHQVDRALNEICGYGLTLEDVPQSFDLQKAYDDDDDVIATSQAALLAIERAGRSAA